MDPTLPRLRNKVCVNEECVTHNKNLWKVDGLTLQEVAGLLGVSTETIQVVKTWSDREWLLQRHSDETNPPTFPISHNSITSFTGEVVYIKYDSENMKFMYVCTVCNRAWKNE